MHPDRMPEQMGLGWLGLQRQRAGTDPATAWQLHPGPDRLTRAWYRYGSRYDRQPGSDGSPTARYLGRPADDPLRLRERRAG